MGSRNLGWVDWAYWNKVNSEAQEIAKKTLPSAHPSIKQYVSDLEDEVRRLKSDVRDSQSRLGYTTERLERALAELAGEELDDEELVYEEPESEYTAPGPPAGGTPWGNSLRPPAESESESSPAAAPNPNHVWNKPPQVPEDNDEIPF